MKVLVTGAAGFIGMHVILALLSQGEDVVGVDNLNDFYDPRLKLARLAHIEEHGHAPRFRFHRINIADAFALNSIFEQHSFDIVIHLAAQAGVRHSLDNPGVYIESNITGFLNILEAMRAQVTRHDGSRHPIQHFLYASSSSVYGGNTKLPFHEDDPVDQPVSLYAATKKTNELMAHTYAHLFRIPSTGLRFFTVYGPWGRPDMAYFSFAKAILDGKPIKLYNYGNMQRDFTYITDVIESLMRVIDVRPTNLPSNGSFSFDTLAPHQVLNIGSRHPEKIHVLISSLEDALSKRATIELAEMQPGDVPQTYADTERLKDTVGFEPVTRLNAGIYEFASWFLDFHSIDNRTQLNRRFQKRKVPKQTLSI
jgi:UDP-glucuronate 4-epimerase